MHYGVCLTSFDRVDCARINEEIIRARYSSCVAVSHATASPTFEPYLEDRLVRRPPLPLHEGAIDLLQASVDALDDWDLPYLVHLEADTWITDEQVILAKIAELEATGGLLSTSIWSPPGWRYGPRVWWGRLKVGGLRHAFTARDYSTQFFVIKNTPEMRQALRALQGHREAEVSFFREVHRRVGPGRVRIMRERSPVVEENRWVCAPLAMHSEHWPAAGTSRDPKPYGSGERVPEDAPGKREALLATGLADVGPNARRLIEATDLDYYNGSAKRY